MKSLQDASVLIAGGSGMIGGYLRRELERNGCKVTILSRSKSGNGFALWDPSTEKIDEAVFSATDVLINLSGEGIASGRWTDKRKQLIRSSRVRPAAFLGRCLNRIPNKIHTVINASAIGYYGNTGDQIVNEQQTAAEGFLGTTCAMWEAAALAMRSPYRRLVIIRIGIVLSKDGGYLAETMKAMKTGIIPVFGNGKQYISWIHPADICGFIAHVIQNPSVTGTFNLTAPNPETCLDVAKALKQVSGSIGLIVKVPAFALRLLLGEMADMLTEGQRTSSEKAEQSGYHFQYKDISTAFKDLLK